MRRVALLITVFALLVSAVPLFAADNQATEKALQAKEQSGWQAWKDHDAKAFDAMLPDNAINITGGGFDKDKQSIMKEISSPDCKVNGFNLSDFSYMWLEKNTVLMTYRATQDATCAGTKLPEKVIASSLWQNKGGKWVSPFHQETVDNSK